MIADLFSDRVIMHFPPDSRPWQQQLACIRAIEVIVLVHRPLHQQSLSLDTGIASRLLLLKVSEGMMSDFSSRWRAGANFDGSHPARLVNRNRCQWLEPHVRTPCRHRIRFRFEDAIGRAKLLRELPAGIFGPLLVRRHVLWVAQRGAPVHPSRDRLNLLIPYPYFLF